MNADHDPLAEEVAALQTAGDQCKDCQRFFPGVDLIPLAHGNVCHECHQLRQDTAMPVEAFDKSAASPMVTGQVHCDELRAQERIRENTP